MKGAADLLLVLQKEDALDTKEFVLLREEVGACQASEIPEKRVNTATAVLIGGATISRRRCCAVASATSESLHSPISRMKNGRTEMPPLVATP